MNERDAYIALNMIDDVGPVRVRAMVAALGSAAAVFEASEQDLLKVEGVGRELVGNILQQRHEVSAADEIAAAQKLGARIITPLDDEYPEPLKSIYDPPLALYVRGTLEKKDRHAIAIVGSRRCTHYGRQTADRLGFQLAKVGFTVVSGLARGIDRAAHEGALKGGGRTLAVLGSALDKLYPPENEDLAEAVAKHGAVLSEYTLGREPDRTTFPYRNRVVSGLSLGVVVVEAPAKSGSLITADMAMEQGRTVFAVPGRIDAPASQGCHRLIKTGAKLVESVDDILEDFDALIPPDRQREAREKTRRPDVALTPEEEGIVRALGQDAL
ncbi:MAG: DNA-processing protein DprA, partial [Kiritimatiellae bacterium]|nr:DNA-processing protein DprA [Kiritimatiellia bacterium]